MTVAKEFQWDAAHRLKSHPGKCSSLHGHRYRMRVEIEGTTNKDGMVVDFADIKKTICVLVDDMDHSTIVSKDDTSLKAFLEAEGQKYFVLPAATTSENLAAYVCRWVKNNPIGAAEGVTVTVWETPTCYASASMRFQS